MLRAKPPEPPEHIKLNGAEMVRWWQLMESREYTAWTMVDLEHAANLARSLVMLERLQDEVATEEAVYTTHSGAQHANPKFKLIDSYSSRTIALSRLLHIHAAATAGDSRDDKKRNAKQRQLSEQRKALEDGDGLIAPPMH